ncbi:MAG: response regulator [Spirosomaceae bacterium]|jgi:CheY-like chemotaxis protein|nr:response regulator [Spirosomataceae bacterium]
MEIKILIVEEDTAAIELYTDILTNYPSIFPEFSDNREDALSKINSNVYDAAILDLKLDNHSETLDGNIIAREIKNNLRFPIYILSGNIEELDEDLKQGANILFKINSRLVDNIFETILNDIIQLKKTGIVDILNRRGKIDSYLQNIFWKHLTNSMPYWIEKAKVEDTQTALLRYTLSHLHEYLEINESGRFEDYHVPEFYIKEPIKKSKETVFTGDIIKKFEDNSYYVVLTPACDLVVDNSRPRPKAKYITLVRVEQVEELLSDMPETTTREKEKKENKIRSLKHDKEYGYHFLPRYDGFYEGGIICFQNILSVKLDDLLNPEKYSVQLSIANSFKKDIIARFSHYYSRQGQPSII